MNRPTMLISMLVAVPLAAAACSKAKDKDKGGTTGGSTAGAGAGTTAGTGAGTAAGTGAGTAAGTGAGTAVAAADGKLEGQVDIIAWPGYIERGETDKKYDWVTKFEADTGCKVNVKTAATSDEMVALMNQGGYDLVTASGDASLRLVAGKKVQPVDLTRIPAYATVDDRLKGAPWYTVDGKAYGVPYQWGPNVLLYNTNVF